MFLGVLYGWVSYEFYGFLIGMRMVLINIVGLILGGGGGGKLFVRFIWNF